MTKGRRHKNRVRRSPRLRPSGLTAWSAFVAALAFLSVPQAASALVSDDFHAAQIDTIVWRVVDPVGDVTFQNTGTNLVAFLPGGTRHNLSSTGNLAARLMQDAANTDFGVEIKFDSKGTATFQGQGIIVQEDADTYLRFEIIYTSTSIRVYAAYFNAGVLTTRRDVTVPQNPPYLRIVRTGNSWSFRYSYEGSNWTFLSPFIQSLAVTEIGIQFNNTASGNAFWATPAFVGNVDYFFDTSSPVLPEDGGQASAPTPPMIEAWGGPSQAFGQLGMPQEWVNILGRVWDTETIDTLFYRLNGGATSALTIGPDGKRLVGIGDYNIEISYGDLTPGANQVVLSAVDVLGERRDTTVTVDYTPGVQSSLPYNALFQSAGGVNECGHIVDGRWYVVSGQGVRVDSSATGYDRLIVIGDRAWETNYEVLLPFTIHASSLGGPAGVGLGIGWQGHVGSLQPRLDPPYQAISWVKNYPDSTRFYLENPDTSAYHVKVGMTPAVTANVRYMMRTRSQSLGGGMSAVKTKLWPAGSPEPAGWDLEAQMPTFSGSMFLIAHRSIATFGNVAITPLPSLEPKVVTIQVVGQGTVTKQPDQPTYALGDTVIVTALPDAGWTFNGWSGGLNGSQNPDTIVIASDTTVTASFSDVLTGVEPPSLVKSFVLDQNRPNPFSAWTSFEYGLPRTSDLDIEVFDVKGRRVFGARVPEAPAGWNRFTFYGRDDWGSPLASGVYFVRVRTNEAVLAKKIVIAR
jgi:uncharacterized repeat protein (TIGR02543 family)